MHRPREARMEDRAIHQLILDSLKERKCQGATQNAVPLLAYEHVEAVPRTKLEGPDCFVRPEETQQEEKINVLVQYLPGLYILQGFHSNVWTYVDQPREAFG